MQARAIFQAAISMSNQGVTVLPEIMVPLVGTPQACFIFHFVFVFLVSHNDWSTLNAQLDVNFDDSLTACWGF